jgi:hypothetical protein
MLLRSILRTPVEDGAEGITDDVSWVLAECNARFGLALDQGLLITLFMVRVWCQLFFFITVKRGYSEYR